MLKNIFSERAKEVDFTDILNYYKKSAFFTLGVLNTLDGWVVSAVEKKMENRLDVELSN